MSFRFQSTYIVKVNDDLGSPSYWNTRFQDLDVRINATESYASKIDASANEIATLGIERVNSAIQPTIDNLNAQITALSASVTSLQGLVITDQNNITSQLAALLAQAQALIVNLEGLGTVADGTF